MNKENSIIKKSSGLKDSKKFPEPVIDNAPLILKEIASVFKGIGRQEDILFFSCIIALSACMPKVFGSYLGKKVYANLFGLISGPAASGKGVMQYAKQLVNKIHVYGLDRYSEAKEKYSSDYATWIQIKIGPKPEQPKQELFLIPGNITSSGLIDLLSNNNRGLMVESEVDTIVSAFSQKQTNYSDVLRQAYHQETYSLYRKTDKEYVELKSVFLSLLISGTNEQVKSLFKSAENGLFSRFTFYAYDDEPNFANPFSSNTEQIDNMIQKYGDETFDLYFEFLNGNEREFKLTEEQQIIFCQKFELDVANFHDATGSEGTSLATRGALMFFKIAMILTVLRDPKSESFICSDQDFDITTSIMNVLIDHSLAVFSTLPVQAENGSANFITALEFLKKMPPSFETKKLLDMFETKGISRRVAFRLIKELMSSNQLKQTKKGHYEKTNI